MSQTWVPSAPPAPPLLLGNGWADWIMQSTLGMGASVCCFIWRPLSHLYVSCDLISMQEATRRAELDTVARQLAASIHLNEGRAAEGRRLQTRQLDQGGG